MSVTQTVKGRIRNKHQTEADWLKSVYVDGDRSKGFLANPFIPLDGELIIYDPDVAHPYKRLKFGDEKTNVDALPFAFYAKNEIDNFEFITFDEVPTADSTSLVTSASVYNALSAKQDILTFDNDPTEGSANPVTSSGLFSKFQAHQEQIDMNAMSATLAMPGSLKWDGVIGDREHIIVGSVDRFNMCFVHVSDEYPALLDPTAAFTVGVVEIGAPQMAYMAEVVIQDDGFIVGDSFVIVPQDNYEADGVVLPKKGVYFMSYHFAPIGYDISFVYCSALSIMGHSFADNSGSDASKYFEKKITTEMGSVGDTLTWDGDTTGRVIVDGGTLGTGILTYCKISESIPTVDAFANGYSNSIVENGVTTTKSYTAEDVKITARDDGYITSLYFMVIPTDNFIVSDSLTVSESGVYFVKAINSETGVVSYVSSLSIPGYDFIAENIITTEIIKTEHLPEALQFGEITTTTYGDTLTWDGNTDGLNGLEYDAEIIATYYKVSDVVPTLEQLKQGCASTRTKTDGTTSSLEFTIELLASLAMADDGSIFILDTLVLTRPITKTDSESGISTTYPAGVYFYTNTNGVYTSSFTINNYSGFVTTTTEFKTIDPKYLPEDIGGGSGGLPEVTTDDNSKTVKVVDGAWSVEKLSYNDLLDKPTLGTLASKNSLSASDVGLGNVENKSSATIRSEITKNNVTTALGYTPLAPGAQHISNKSSGTYYYKLGTMVADNSSNYGNITISGRLGGWEQSNSANFDIMMLNRSSARDGNTITATVSASGMVADALTKCDIVVYRQSDTSEIVYLKLNGYWLYDFDWNVYQHSISYSATNVTPTGSLVWSLSTAPKTILDASGNFYINGNQAATINDVNSAIEAAIGAAIAASY